MSRVLLVDDSVDCQILVSRALQDSVSLDIAPAVSDAKALLASKTYDLVLLDVSLPDGNGFGLCSSLLAEAKDQRPRIVFLTGSESISEKLTGFSVGGDDYITKPFNPLELKARILAHLRAHTELSQSAELLRTGNLVLNLAAHSVEAHYKTAVLPVQLDLTPTEFKLLYALAKNEGRILSREKLLAAASDHAEDLSDRTIDAHLSKLRKKLGDCSHGIEAVYSVGYRWVRQQSK